MAWVAGGGGSKTHVVITPFPLQSHITSFLKLAKVLHSKGFHITYVNTEYNKKRLLNARGAQALDGLSDFRFETIPDGLPPPSDANVSQRFSLLCGSMRNHSLVPFTKLLARLNKLASDGVMPPVTCLISDVIMSFTMDAAQEFGLPIALYWPASTVSFLGIFHFRTLLDKDVIPLKDRSCLTNGYLNTELDWLPGMKNMRLKDIPSFARVTDSNNFLLNFLMAELQRAQKAQAIIFNTFEGLDSEALNTLSSIFPPLYSIGPLSLLINQIPQHNHHLLGSIGSNLWKEETQCLDWLQLKEPESVIYVNFGSLVIISTEQLHEFAWGLANSKKQFLWIIRSNLVEGGSMILSPEFLSEIKDRGFIANWCEQEKVLNHPSIGGFLTHCGWNSMTESICAGVPMACWPWSGDQQTNCRYACREWGIGIEIENNVKREEVEKLVNDLMEGEEGKKMRLKISEWKKIAEEDTRPGGSSYINLENLINVLVRTNV